MIFKTSEQCRLELAAYTVVADGTAALHDGWVDAGFLPVSAARASFAREDKTGWNEPADLKLMRFLADHKHVSCFEHNYATFLVECPLFVRSQIMRHSSFSFNEVSRRYTSEQIEFWIPDKWRKQSKSNKQASEGEVETAGGVKNWEHFTEAALDYYDLLLEQGVCREQARAVLPQALLTRFYMSGNLRSWWSFLSSRLKEDTQWETRVVAQRIEKELRSLWPDAMAALMGDHNAMA